VSEQENLQTVRTVFDCFGRGDAEGMLSVIADDVVWRLDGAPSVPYSGERRGHEGVVDFLQRLGGNVEFEHFEPQEFIAGGDKVVVTGTERGRVRTNGRTFTNDWAMVFTLRAGKVTGFRCYEDTGAVAAAFEGGSEVGNG
jgi:ketosteroid isomerase-like protein